MYDRRLSMPDAAERQPGIASRVDGPLCCPACGGAVPLGDGDELECPYCQARVPVPADYRALRDAEREHSADRAHAAALYEKLGHAPGPLLQRWVRMSLPMYEGAARVLRLGWLAVFVVLVSVAIVGHWVAPYIGVDFVDLVGGKRLYGGIALVFAVLVVMPVALASYLDHFVRSRGSLQRSLAAAMPEQPGGPSLCRNCGAPLHVAAGALGVRCVYCGSDNLVALPHDWVEQIGRFEHKAHQTVIEAVEAERADSVAAKRLLVKRLGIGLGAVIVLGWLGDGLSLGPSQRWSSAFVPGRRLLPVWHDDWHAVVVPIGQPTRLPCNRSDCEPRFLAALHDGEYLVLSSPTIGGASVTITNSAAWPRWVKRPAWKLAPGDGYRAVFHAPYTGFFYVELDYSPVGGAELEWRTATRAPPR